MKEVNEELKISKGSISKVCCGMLNHAKGYVWRYE